MEKLYLNSVKKSRIPAKLDWIQSATGLFLALFMWAHMALVASILISKDAMFYVARTLEASFLSGNVQKGYPVFVVIAVGIIAVVFILHAFVAIRKFPIDWKQYRTFRNQMQTMKHKDTNLWFIQAVTGFIMFFVGSFHLFFMITHPGSIGPHLSGDRVFSGFWPFYLVLLFAVELHGTIGLYRLCVKWGWFDGKQPKQTRKRLRNIKQLLTVFFLILGLLTLGSYWKIGYLHQDQQGQRYVPSFTQRM